MFWPDIIEVRHFYQTKLGQLVLDRLKTSILDIWPTLHNEVIVGIGYSFPYLRLYNEEAMDNQIIAITPTNMGVRHWPDSNSNKAIIAEEYEIPLPNNSVNAVLLMHALEYSEQAESMLQEIWRILVPGGRILTIVPHRRSLWSHMENTPLGHGHPFTATQAKSLLADSCFAIRKVKPALFFPPTSSNLMLKTIPIWEGMGQYVLQAVGGVLCIEAEKKIYAALGKTKKSRAKKSIYLPMPESATPRSF